MIEKMLCEELWGRLARKVKSKKVQSSIGQRFGVLLCSKPSVLTAALPSQLLAYLVRNFKLKVSINVI